MIDSRLLAASAALLCSVTVSAAGAGAAAPRYRMVEVPEPQFAGASCLPGYARRFTATGINDLGVVSANLWCVDSIDTAAGFFNRTYLPYIAAPHLGAYELALPTGAFSGFALSIDNRLRVVGDSTDNLRNRGALWTLGGGHEPAFQQFGCLGGDVDQALGGNLRGYVVGWAVRTDPSAAPPLDQFCITVGWVIRTPAGATIYGPTKGVAVDVNELNVAVGRTGRTAIKYHIPTGQQTILDAGSAPYTAEPVAINERGEVAGFLDFNPDGNPGVLCGPSVPLAWDRNNVERTLELLPGATSGRVYSLGSDGDIVGDSGSGRYCSDNALFRQRAALWHDGRPYDLNTLIPDAHNVTLVGAARINLWGQIAVTGYRNDDPLLLCPDFTESAEGGFGPVDFTLTCRDLHTWVLTPTGR